MIFNKKVIGISIIKFKLLYRNTLTFLILIVYSIGLPVLIYHFFVKNVIYYVLVLPLTQRITFILSILRTLIFLIFFCAIILSFFLIQINQQTWDVIFSAPISIQQILVGDYIALILVHILPTITFFYPFYAMTISTISIEKVFMTYAFFIITFFAGLFFGVILKYLVIYSYGKDSMWYIFYIIIALISVMILGITYTNFLDQLIKVDTFNIIIWLLPPFWGYMLVEQMIINDIISSIDILSFLGVCTLNLLAMMYFINYLFNNFDYNATRKVRAYFIPKIFDFLSLQRYNNKYILVMLCTSKEIFRRPKNRIKLPLKIILVALITMLPSSSLSKYDIFLSPSFILRISIFLLLLTFVLGDEVIYKSKDKLWFYKKIPKGEQLFVRSIMFVMICLSCGVSLITFMLYLIFYGFSIYFVVTLFYSILFVIANTFLFVGLSLATKDAFYEKYGIATVLLHSSIIISIFYLTFWAFINIPILEFQPISLAVYVMLFAALLQIIIISIIILAIGVYISSRI